jgi:hypothetical protein
MILLLLSLFKSALQRKLVLLFNVSQSSNLFCGTQDIHSPETHWSFVGSRKAEATLAICSIKETSDGGGVGGLSNYAVA